MPTLEKYEWTNTWWDEPSNEGTRVLLVGDSITNAYRSHVKDILGGEIYVDMLATSRALDNPALWEELRHMLVLTRYDVIHFNNGLHGFHLSRQQYEEGYEAILRDITVENPNARVILALSTPVTRRDDCGALSESENNTVIERNEVVVRLAERFCLPVDDLYTLVLGNAAIKSTDGYHFHIEGQKLQAAQVAECILKRLS